MVLLIELAIVAHFAELKETKSETLKAIFLRYLTRCKIVNSKSDGDNFTHKFSKVDLF